MFNQNALKAALAMKGKTLANLAAYLGINKSTLSKKINGRSEWTLPEIQKTGDVVGKEKIKEIFFDEKVS
jgi:transcriptional regulator with XRE-family HTH domain